LQNCGARRKSRESPTLVVGKKSNGKSQLNARDVEIMDADIILCLRSWASELNDRANRVRALIGSAHWLTDGHQKEFILREFLSRHLCPKINLARGFIRPPDPENPTSGEIDILLSDFDIHPPWFNEGGVVIVPPSAVVGQIHVKTTFGSSEMVDMLRATGEAYQSIEPYMDPHRVWTGGLFFNLPTRGVKNLERSLESWIGSFVFDWGSKPPLPRYFPNCVAVIGGPVIFFEKGSQQARTIHVKAFNCNELAPAVMLADLFEHLQAHGRGQRKRGALTNLLERAQMQLLFTKDFGLQPKADTRKRHSHLL
jgi:hypothetical protein